MGLLEDGGGWEVWCWAYLYCMVALFVLDLGVASIFFNKARWFSLHVMANAIITIWSLPDFFMLFTNPLECIYSKALCSVVPLTMNWSIHTYHVLMFRDLDWLDWLHHGLMTFVLIPIGFLTSLGPLLNASHVFITGFPGGMDYAMLSAVKHGRMLPMTEKRINNKLNLWIRAPGIVAVCALGHAQTFTQLERIPVWEIACRYVSFGLYFWNAQFFMERVVGNFHTKSYLAAQARKADKK